MITYYFRYDPKRDAVLLVCRDFFGLGTERSAIVRWRTDNFRALIRAMNLPPEPKKPKKGKAKR